MCCTVCVFRKTHSESSRCVLEKPKTRLLLTPSASSILVVAAGCCCISDYHRRMDTVHLINADRLSPHSESPRCERQYIAKCACANEAIHREEKTTGAFCFCFCFTFFFVFYFIFRTIGECVCVCLVTHSLLSIKYFYPLCRVSPFMAIIHLSVCCIWVLYHGMLKHCSNTIPNNG